MTTSTVLHRLASGHVIADRYEVLHEIGHGGRSVVYAARDRETDDVVALKVLMPSPTGEAAARERMRREMHIAQSMDDPRIVAIHDYLEEGGQSILVMEYVPGPDLAARLRDRGALTVAEAVAIGRQLAQTLERAHHRGIVHRDIKPENVMLHRMEGARLTDFGAARLDGRTGLTGTGELAGTLLYAAPELLAGERGDARSDLYSLGLTLFVALVNHLPERPSPHLPPNSEPGGHHPGRSRGGVHVPPWLDDVIARATAADPADRFHTAADFDRALDESGVNAGFQPPPVVQDVEDTCIVCHAPSPFGLDVCGPCGGMSREAADNLLFLRRTTRQDRGEAASAVSDLLDGAGRDDGLHDALLGRRALARIPATASARALHALGARHLGGRLIPAGRAWSAVPGSYYALLLAIFGGGLATGLNTSPMFLWSTPVVTVLLFIGAVRTIRMPLFDPDMTKSPLPVAIDQQMAKTLVTLRIGPARRLLADIVRMARGIDDAGTTDLDLQARVAHLAESACTAAMELDGLDEHLERFEQQRRELSHQPQEWWDSLTEVETSRDRLAYHLLQVVGALGRAKRLGADAVNGATAELANVLAETRLNPA